MACDTLACSLCTQYRTGWGQSLEHQQRQGKLRAHTIDAHSEGLVRWIQLYEVHTGCWNLCEPIYRAGLHARVCRRFARVQYYSVDWCMLVVPAGEWRFLQLTSSRLPPQNPNCSSQIMSPTRSQIWANSCLNIFKVAGKSDSSGTFQEALEVS